MKNTTDYNYLERADYTWSSDSIRFINTPSVTARQIFFYVQEVGYFKTAAPYFTERANLNSFLLFYTISGKGRLEYGGTNYYLLPGSVALINCMDHHYYECLSGQEWEFLWLHFNGVTALGYYQELIRNGFRILTEMDPFFMESSMRRILALTQKKDVHSEIIVSDLINRLLTQILITNSSQNLDLGFMPPYLQSALHEIEKHYAEPLSLDSLSAMLHLSKYHFAREFKRYLGVPFYRYLVMTRLNHAKEVLKYTDQSVEQVAFSNGFHQVSQFIILFKKYEQMTPLQYRKEWGI